LRKPRPTNFWHSFSSIKLSAAAGNNNWRPETKSPAARAVESSRHSVLVNAILPGVYDKPLQGLHSKAQRASPAQALSQSSSSVMLATMIERIDAHHHLWRYSKKEYGWIAGDMAPIARDFLPQDLQKVLTSSGMQGGITVQARQTLEETQSLLNFAQEFPFIRGVVGWAPIARPEFPQVLERFHHFEKLKGFRHVVQDEPDDAFLLRPDFNAGIALFKRYGLVYDILIFERQLPAAISFVDRHPAQVFVLDHIAKPRIRDQVLEPWRTNIRELARRENVFCKLSGMVTEAEWAKWRPSDLEPYFDVILNAFGPKRLLAGSDWPVCLLATAYQTWFSTLGEFLSSLSSTDQEMILGGVASEVYSLSPKACIRRP
jgi:L-fuconolactonase